MNFSEREGYKKIIHNPLESMDANLKNAIWTQIYTKIEKDFISWGNTSYGSHTYQGDSAKLLWTNFFQKNISKLPDPEVFSTQINSLYDELEWNGVYDLIEFLINQKHISPEKFNK